MKHTYKTLDVYFWDSKKNGIESRDLDYKTSEEYAFFKNKCQVGCCAIEVHSHIKSFRGVQQFYPDSWFIGDSEYLKPILDVPAYSCEKFKHKGFGRAGLQFLFRLSKQKGCEGRIHLQADKEGPAFYEHCGFIGLVDGQDGLKYFDPTPGNVAKLFSKQNVSLEVVRTLKAKKGASYTGEVIAGLVRRLNQLKR